MILELQNIVKIFNEGTIDEAELFRDFHFGVKKGEFVSIIGSNGSGKTTMLNLICGADTAQEGKFLFEGKDITGLSEHRRAKFIGRVFQDPKIGTCAGLILLAKNVEGGLPCFATMDISVKRNAYGRQLGSFHTVAQMEGVGEIPMTFIRAPYIAAVGPKAQVLAEVDGHIVAARQGNQLVTAFHPELDEDTSVHQYFLDMTK